MFDKNLDTILGTFTKLQKDLENFIDKNTNKKVSLEEQRLKLDVTINDTSKEIEKAFKVKAKIGELING